MTRPLALPTAVSSPSYRSPSLPRLGIERVGWNRRGKSTPSSPIAVSAAALDECRARIARPSSSRQCGIRARKGVSITAALISRIECASGIRRMPNRPLEMRVDVGGLDLDLFLQPLFRQRWRSIGKAVGIERHAKVGGGIGRRQYDPHARGSG